MMHSNMIQMFHTHHSYKNYENTGVDQMLNYFKEKDLVLYSAKQPETWEEAIAISCQKLVEHELITEEYIDEIINAVHEFGPYIVIVPQVAMPHAKPDSPGLLGTGISFTKFPEEVNFIEPDTGEKKPATLFFTLAAKNSDEHLENITNLMELLSDDEMIPNLLATENIEDFDKLLN